MALGPFIGDWINQNPGKALGGGAGFLLGILLLTIGPAKTLIIILLVVIGLFAGKLVDDRVSLPGPLGSLFKRKGKKTDDDEEFY